MYLKFRKAYYFLLILTFVVFSCDNNLLPKPKAQLRLEYKKPTYALIETDCPYQFEYSNDAIIKINKKCWVNIEYPRLNATINLTYRPVSNNLKELFLEAEKLTFNHAIKADGISSIPYENSSKKLFGSIFQVTGNAASPLQFHVTDSTNNFITGAVYFNIQPNYDSIIPAINYLHKDIMHLIESLEWKENGGKLN